jgi:hypothetical protein
MNGKKSFTVTEMALIKKLVELKNKSSADKQKGIRQKIRNLKFYYTDFPAPISKYTTSGIDELIRAGYIKIVGNSKVDSNKEKHKSEPTVKPKKNSSIMNTLGEDLGLTFSVLDELRALGFVGFKKMSELFDDYSCIPKMRGVYMVLTSDSMKQEYLEIGTGGFFKDKNPNISIADLKSNWVNETIVLYIGKAGSMSGSSTLYKRLRQYLLFGQGKNIGHYGGRLIWQLKNSKDLIVCWKELTKNDPDELESKLIGKFKLLFGKRPFANLTK